MPDLNLFLKIENRLSTIETKLNSLGKDLNKQNNGCEERYKSLCKDFAEFKKYEFAKLDKKATFNQKMIWLGVGGISTIIMVIQALSSLKLI